MPSGAMTSSNGIRALRTKHGLSQPQLAEMLGMTKSDISRLEKGDTKLSVERAAAIANALGATLEEVIGLIAAGLKEDAVPYTARPNDPFLRLTVGSDQMLYTMTTSALDELGIQIGDVLVVDIAAEATRKIKSGDVVLATARDKASGVKAGVTLARQFIHPHLLITNSRSANQTPLHIEQDEAPIMGIVVSFHRRWQG